MTLLKLLRLLHPVLANHKQSLTPKLVLLCLLIQFTPALQAQTKTDTTVNTNEVKMAISDIPKLQPEGKKTKGKKKEKATPATIADSVQTDAKPAKQKKGKASKMDQILAEKKAQNAADSVQANKHPKKGKTTAKKTAQPVPEPVAKVIPGAEAKANAETKDKEDRTMKGPSGQKVYSSPKGGKYYFDINGNKKYLKRDKEK